MAERSLDKELQRLRSDFVTLQEDMADVAGLLQELAATRAASARHSAADAWHSSSREIGRRLQRANSRRREAAEDVRTRVTGHPFLSLAIAFGAGFIVAAAGILARRE